MKLRIYIILLSLFASSCTTQQFEEQMLGKQREFIEPTSDFALVTLEAPTLTKFAWQHDKIEARFYDACSSSLRSDPEYMGAVTLSTKPQIGKKKTLKVPAGNTLFLEMGHTGDVQCTGKHSWTPISGSHYRFTYNLDGWSCITEGVELLENGVVKKIEGLDTYKNKDGFFQCMNIQHALLIDVLF